MYVADLSFEIQLYTYLKFEHNYYTKQLAIKSLNDGNVVCVPALTVPQKLFFFKSVIIWSNFILKTLQTMSGLSEVVKPLDFTKSRISCQLTLHVIVIKKFG